MKTIYFFRQSGSEFALRGTTSNLDKSFKMFNLHNPGRCYIVDSITTPDIESVLVEIDATLNITHSPKPGFYSITDEAIHELCRPYVSGYESWLPILKRIVSVCAGERLSNIQIQELLGQEGVQTNHIQVGRALAALGLKKRQARINGRVKLAYQL